MQMASAFFAYFNINFNKILKLDYNQCLVV